LELSLPNLSETQHDRVPAGTTTSVEPAGTVENDLVPTSTAVIREEHGQEVRTRPVRFWVATLWQLMRFGMVGILNTLIDVGTLNVLLWRFPTHNPNLLLAYNTCAYCLGALNSFCLNKYWTFRHRHTLTAGEVARFAAVSIAGILCNDGILWLVARILHPVIANTLIWANLSKGMAIAGTMTISYLGMRLWVFTKKKK
jgi:putative flippase GtrA